MKILEVSFNTEEYIHASWAENGHGLCLSEYSYLGSVCVCTAVEGGEGGEVGAYVLYAFIYGTCLGPTWVRGRSSDRPWVLETL